MTSGEASATRHAELVGNLDRRLGIKVARLPRNDSATTRTEAYQAQVVVGSINEFLADFESEGAGQESIHLVLPTPHEIVGFSDDLLTRLPRTLAAMDRGELDAYKASKIADVTAALSTEKCREVDAALAGKVAGKDPAQIRRATRDLVHRIDGAGANERAMKRREDRKIELCHDELAVTTPTARR